MAYSKLKPIVQELHRFGWRKIPGVRPYRKVWYRGKYQVSASIQIESLYDSVIPVSDLLQQQEQRAIRELDV